MEARRRSEGAVPARLLLQPLKIYAEEEEREVFKDAADEAEQKNWRRMMREIEESGSAVSILKTQRSNKEPLPRDAILGTLVRFKQLKNGTWSARFLNGFAHNTGNYAQARKLFAQMSERGIPLSTVTFNSLMSFETNYKEVSSIYDQMQRSGLKPDVVSYSLLIKAYGKARREEEALAVFEEMLDAGVSVAGFMFIVFGQIGERHDV
ncbi:hypothetical protein GUJ93_ZPchr1182g33299 [Zizania palustris]|uniref:Pentatricopeptide repeat-containing protein n=1 Tax=Zizania palustris TaxID=103762 RepID=A0A8J5UZC9_ZIZPA|nr:hypothetical protein GUJ93_ZPchr1182g33299 [Zizania palustris]